MTDPRNHAQAEPALTAISPHSEATNAEPPAAQTVSADGLTDAEAQRRLAQYGYNELPEKKRNPLVEFLVHFWGPIPWMIEAAAVLSAVVGRWVDLVIISVLLFANAVVGFWEEFQAGNAIAALFRGDRFATTLQFALVLTVAAIPVAMPTVLSVTMAVGARLLAGKQAIVSRLVAIEELAGMDVLCSDKTGTLTRNKLTLGDAFCVEGVSADEVILAGALASRAENQDSIDLAVLGGLENQAALAGVRVTQFQPFDPVHKRTEADVEGGNSIPFKVTKGAPQVILALAANRDAVQAAVEGEVNKFARRGFRSLGIARTDARGEWQFLGVLPLFDPQRPDSAQTIRTAREMGVAVKMVTGDQLAIGKEIAGKIGLGAVVGTQRIATLIAALGIFMKPIDWEWVLAVWGYALAWFFVNDRIKLAAYRLFHLTEPGILGQH